MTQMAGFAFNNSYARLPERFYAKLPPVPVSSPRLVAFNDALAHELSLELPASDDACAQIFSGNVLPGGSEPLAMAYAGHQFGGFSPQLGDGRAILIGEVAGRDIQLKGSGRTPWSRGGDGRAWLGPVLREYVVSEAMAALGVPTTRALAAVETGDEVLREEPLPGAVLTRVAASHLRVGTFQYFAVREDLEGLRQLMDYAIDRHYPKAKSAACPALAFLSEVVSAQAQLIAQWMGIGFIHGVMNTDNCAISGETIDFGPCAFMDHYHPDQVYSSIDRGGRYAFSNQPRIGHWNVAQLASSLLPLIDPDTETAIAQATEVVDGFASQYQSAWTDVFVAKTGTRDVPVIMELLSAMAADGADWTNTFRALSGLLEDGDFGPDAPSLNDWLASWRAAFDPDLCQKLDNRNPAIIPRNHQIEQMISAAREGNYAHFEKLAAAFATPFAAPDDPLLTRPPEPQEVVHATFCGT